jgi:hypothetical protein
MALRLAKNGWWDGDPEKILGTSADAVMKAIHFEDFCGDYESELVRLNKPEEKA